MLYLYKGITPNLSSTYYFFNNFNNFLNAIKSHKIKEVDNDKYTINNGTIRFKLDNTITEDNYKSVTYIVNTVGNVCYHVVKAVTQSGYVMFRVNTDLWGSYIKDAKLKNIKVTKCNRKISDNGIYDSIDNTKDYDIEFLDSTTELDLINSIIVVCIRYNDGFLMTFTQMIAGAIEFSVATKDYNNIILTSALIGGLHKVKPYGGNDYKDAEVVNAWILPRDVVQLLTEEYKPFSFKSYNFLTGGELTATEALPSLRPSIVRKTFTLQDMDINKKYVVGTINNGIEVLRKTNKKATITYTFSIGQNEVKVLVDDGNEQKDISSAFSISLAKAHEEVNASNKIASVMSYLTGVVQLGIGVVKESPLSVVRGIGRIGTQISRDINEKPTKPSYNVIGGGDASTTFNKETDFTHLLSPYRVNTVKSLLNEGIRARKTGANFNEYIDKIDYIFNYELLGTGSVNDDTFVIASLDVDGIPTEAVDLIQSRFNEGIYLQKV